MIYTDEERKNHIYEIQSDLRTISRYHQNIPLLIPDGIYGPETTEAVKAFQQNYGLPITGDVNEDTWNAIQVEYRGILAEISPAYQIDAFPGRDFILNRGSLGETVIFLQLMLVSIGNVFQNIPHVQVNGIFGAATEDAVKKIQQLSLLNVTGIVNRATWDRTVALYNVHSKPVFPRKTK